MAIRTPEYLKTRFENNDKPTAQDFIDLIDTLATKEQVGTGGSEILNAVSDLYISNSEKGVAGGVATLDEDGRLNEVANSAINASFALDAQKATNSDSATNATNATNYKDGINNISIKDALEGKQASLGFFPEDVANKSNTISGHSSILYPTLTAIINYIANTVGSAIVLQGDWNANTNTPDISGTTTVGHAWRVSVAGTTDLDGIVIWAVGDLAVYTANGFTKIGNELIQVSWGALIGDINSQQDLIDKFAQYILKIDISTDNTLGGATPSDAVISSEKAIKEYIDNEIDNVDPVLTSELIPNTYTGIPLNVPIPIGTPIETIVRNLLRTYVAPSFQSFSVGLTPSQTYYEVGTQVTVGNAPFVIINDSDGSPATSVKVSGNGFLSATVRTASPAIPDSEVLTYIPTTISNQDWTISGKDKNDVTVSRLFRVYNKHRMYFGSSATELTSVSSAINVQTLINTLLDGILISSRTSNISGTANTATLTCTANNNDVTKYTYIAYVSSLGDITSIIKDGALPVLGAFTRLGVWSIMSRTGTNLVSIPLTVVVYKSNSTGAFPINTTLNIR